MHNITDDVITPKTLKAGDIQTNRGMNGENIHLECIGKQVIFCLRENLTKRGIFTANQIANILPNRG